MSITRESLRSVLRQTGLITPIRWFRYWIDFLTVPTFRQLETKTWRDFIEWKRDYQELLRPSLNGSDSSLPFDLIVGKGTADGAKIELGFMKSAHCEKRNCHGGLRYLSFLQELLFSVWRGTPRHSPWVLRAIHHQLR
jgi:hypothetical protein